MGQGGREWQQMYGVQGEISEVWGYQPRSSFLHWLAHSVGFSMPYRLVQGTYMLWLMHHWAEANALKQELSKKMDLEGASELYKGTLTPREAHIFYITHSLLFFPFVCTHIENTYIEYESSRSIRYDQIPYPPITACGRMILKWNSNLHLMSLQSSAFTFNFQDSMEIWPEHWSEPHPG